MRRNLIRVLLFPLRVFAWPFRTATRLLCLGWVTALIMVGAVANASANPGDDIFGGSDIAGGAAQTVFERIPWTAYTVPAQISPLSDNSFLGLMQPVYAAAIGVTDVVMFLVGGLVKGALLAVQWFLSLGGLYAENSQQIDNASAALANRLFWPLIGATFAVGAAVVYGKARRGGNTSILSDALWLIVATVLAVTFVAAPSKIMNDLDSMRQQVADAGANGYAAAAGNVMPSPAGFDAVAVPDTSNGAIRGLTEGLWNSYYVAPWCEVAWGDLALCKKLGHEYLNDSGVWKTVQAKMAVLDIAGSAPGGPVSVTDPATGAPIGNNPGASGVQCPEEIPEANCSWVRGSNFGRLGMVLFAAVLALPGAFMMFALVFYGVLAFVGLLLLVLMGAAFLVACMIPGRPRSIGVKWAEALVGCLLQTILITFLLGGVMVVSGLITNMSVGGMVGKALLNVAVLMVALKFRSQFDVMSGMAHAGGGAMNSYLAFKALGGMSKAVKGLGSKIAGAGMGAAKLAGKGAAGGINQLTDSASATRKGVSASAQGARQLRQQMQVPSRMPTGGVATPYRSGPNQPQTAVGAGSFAQTPQYHGAGAPTGGQRQLPVGQSRTVDALPSAPPMKALPVSASSNAGPKNGNPIPANYPAPTPEVPKRNQQQSAPRLFQAPTSQSGAVPSAQRRLVTEATRKNTMSPPQQARSKVVSYGNASPYAVTHRKPVQTSNPDVLTRSKIAAARAAMAQNTPVPR